MYYIKDRILKEIFNSYKELIERCYEKSKVVSMFYFKNEEGFSDAFFIIKYKGFFIPMIRRNTCYSGLIGVVSMRWNKRQKKYYEAMNKAKELIEPKSGFKTIFHNVSEEL